MRDAWVKLKSKTAFKCGMRISFKLVKKPHMKNKMVNALKAKVYDLPSELPVWEG